MHLKNFSIETSSSAKLVNDDFVNDRMCHSPKFEVQVINSTRRNLVVVMRNGVKYELPDSDQPLSPGVRVIYKVSFNETMLDKLRSQVLQQETIQSPEQRVLASVLEKNDITRDGLGIYHATVEFFLDVSYIENANNQSAYFSDLDILVSFNPIYKVPAHPFSEEGIATDVHDLVINDAIPSLGGVTCYIVDNKNVVGDCWIALDNQIYFIEAIKSQHLSDGIYVNQYNVMDNGGAKCYKRRYKLDDLDKVPLMLYRSRQEAIESSDNLKAMEFDYKRRKLEYDMEREELSRQQTLLTQQQKDLEIQRKELETKLEMERAREAHFRTLEENRMKQEMERRKYHYEERSTDRKDTSDGLKLGLSVVAFGLGLLALAKK